MKCTDFTARCASNLLLMLLHLLLLLPLFLLLLLVVAKSLAVCWVLLSKAFTIYKLLVMSCDLTADSSQQVVTVVRAYRWIRDTIK